MARHVLDQANRTTSDAPLMRYTRAAHAGTPVVLERKLAMLRRRAKGPFNPSARMRAYLRIERRSDA
ncbi:MAG: hypothetical protein AAGG09_01605 [Pseudomonadota bacterium]